MSDESEARVTRAEWWKREAIELIKFLAGAAAVFMVITTLLFRTFYIPSGSMEPTLEVEDRVIVLNFVYGWSRHSLQFGLGSFLPPAKGRLFGRLPGRGDVIVFRHPDPDRREHLIKRVIGLPGDRVQVRAGRLYINDVEVPREPDGVVTYRNYTGQIERDMKRYVETLPPSRPGGRSVRHFIYEESDDFDDASFGVDDTRVFVVPEGEVFVMGDNRDNSGDSRSSLGSIPVDLIVGRAVTVLFTFHSCKREQGLWCPTGRVLRPL